MNEDIVYKLKLGDQVLVKGHPTESFNGFWEVTGIHEGGITIVTGHIIPSRFLRFIPKEDTK